MTSVPLPNGLTRLMARMLPMSVLVNTLESSLGGRPVVDKTGLTAKYDFTLDFDPEALAADSIQHSGPDLVAAVRDQLGLRVEPKGVPVDVLVIDSADEIPINN